MSTPRTGEIEIIRDLGILSWNSVDQIITHSRGRCYLLEMHEVINFLKASCINKGKPQLGHYWIEESSTLLTGMGMMEILNGSEMSVARCVVQFDGKTCEQIALKTHEMARALIATRRN